MRLQERRVAVGDLLVGMYVSGLDRGWEGTPFALQGVAIRSPADIVEMTRYCEHVYVDIEMGVAPAEKPAADGYGRVEIEKRMHSVAYRDSVRFEDELVDARRAQETASSFATRMLDDVREGRPISADEVRGAVEPMVRSIVRNMDAFLWVESLRKRDAYDYNHALSCSALAAAFGRHLGFPEELLADLASGGLLLDVGKLRIPAAIFSKPGALDPAEMTEAKRHVALGIDALEEHAPLPPQIRDMIRTHHERDNGRGYPDRMSGESIPLFGRIAAVVDSYDAMISERSYRPAKSRHQALQELYRERGSLYSAEIVEQFMQCLSVYPTGSLVELSDGRVAVVMAQNPARRLRPRVMVLTGPDKSLVADFRMLDLMQDAPLADDDDPDSVGVLVTRTLEPGAYGLDPAELYL